MDLGIAGSNPVTHPQVTMGQVGTKHVGKLVSQVNAGEEVEGWLRELRFELLGRRTLALPL